MYLFLKPLTIVLSLTLLGCSHTVEPESSQQPQKLSPKRDAVVQTQLARIAKASQTSTLSFDIVAELTSEVGPRIAGSAGDKKAIVWAEQTFTKLGFDKVYKQAVRVRNWERGFADAKVIIPEQHDLTITALGGSIATPENGIQAEVIRFTSLEALSNSATVLVEGKIVYIDQSMQRDRAGRFYGKVVPNRVRGAVEAAKKGALAVIIRSVGTANSQFAHTGVMRYDDEVTKIPAGALSAIDADKLTQLINTHDKVSISLNMQAKETGWQTSYNVIGEITGTTHPDEVILISAHLDSWDLGTGALDDGAGVGIVMAAAKLIKDTLGQPRRTIRVILYAAEEIGLVGAFEYAKANSADLPNIILAAESDFGAGRIYRMDTRFAPEVRDDAKILYDALAQMNIELGNNTSRGGPDVSMLPNYGVPVLSLRQDGTYYFDYHHTADDTLDKIDLEAIMQNQTAWSVVTAFFANTDFDPRPAPEL